MEIERSDGERLLRRADYERLAAEGAFTHQRVELLFGRVVAMTPINAPHRWSVYSVHEQIRRAVGRRAHVLCQTSFAASEISEPEPDICVIPTGPDYWREDPTRALLVVEVADSSLPRDRGIKRELYALADVDEYWIVDLAHGCIEVYRDRLAGRWETVSVHHRGDAVAMFALPDVAIFVDDVVPPAP
ncbi:MAG: Uma2 family endonuclease [Deltaproteobacteria bacterium]|nr:Uma2 family endonuclease [Deltaproteobacteria bacterium]